MKLIKDNKIYIQGYNVKYLVDNDLLNNFDYLDVINSPYAFFSIGNVDSINLNLVRGINSLNSILSMSLEELIEYRDKRILYKESKTCDMLLFDYLLSSEDLNMVINYFEDNIFGNNLIGLNKVKLEELIEICDNKYISDSLEMNIKVGNFLDLGKALSIKIKNNMGK